MRYFRSVWLRRILVGQLLFLLSAAPFAFIGPQGIGKDDVVLSTATFVDKVSLSLRQIEIDYLLLCAILVSGVYGFNQVLLGRCVPKTSSDPVLIDLLTRVDRGPPYLNSLL